MGVTGKMKFISITVMLVLGLVGCKTTDIRGIHGTVLINTQTGERYLPEKAGDAVYNLHYIDASGKKITYVK